MTQPTDIAAMQPREAYLAGFAEAQRRALWAAAAMRGANAATTDGPFVRGGKQALDTLASIVREMQPERA